MGVYIKDMEMPKSCGDCRFCGGIADTDCGPCAWCDVDGKARVADTRQDCPLVPVPPNVINFDKPYSFTISWDGEQLKGNIIGTAI